MKEVAQAYHDYTLKYTTNKNEKLRSNRENTKLFNYYSEFSWLAKFFNKGDTRRKSPVYAQTEAGDLALIWR